MRILQLYVRCAPYRLAERVATGGEYTERGVVSSAAQEASMERARASALSRQVMLDFMQMQGFVEDPLVIERAEGVRVWDTDGKGYIDGLSGIFVVNMGHNRPEIVEAMVAQ